MKSFALIAALLSSTTFSPVAAAQEQTIQFDMTVSGGARECLPKAFATVTDHTFGNFENLEVVVHNLPPNTGFDFFIIQVPNKPFLASWYMGDINTDSTGTGVGNFVGRFSSETFIISPDSTPAPNEFPDPPAFVPEATGSVKTNPVQMYHLGLWFNSPGCRQKGWMPRHGDPFQRGT
jgi:hypothetical protein